ncbi:MAG: type I glutamate--ammonia ligase [Gammaproteobacteria bacterium CG11_big_fil_rev_8_21_14_0_20_46_22]|nr:MAG: type I glutamate--ammonia ligase [Gammaproteobacteria bacterium CG12_big_fil_rev_8_21_14_0_65_46_12]PIR10635.1 MAG: type I glutamate--ammonia ligase [Gammaproteobacteria bacterium CG11_big_fil_rev_8_21_14_0_20_46_22]
MSNRVNELIEQYQAKYVDVRFTDTRGKEQHVTIPVAAADEAFFKYGKMFDGSSIAGWRGIQESDMILMPDPDTAFLDAFRDVATVVVRCDVIDPVTKEGYERDPRSIAKHAERYLVDSGVGDEFLVGPEPEFFMFDDVRWGTEMNGVFYSVDSREGAWNSSKEYKDGNKGYRPTVKGGYFPVPPVDSSQDIRTAMSEQLRALGIVVEAHHHEVATGNQNEIAFRFNTLLKKADELQVFKYVIQNVARQYGKSVTFMPKPIVGDNGSGMHVHQSIAKGGKNLFAGDKYAGLSQMALYYIGGIIKHARAINAFTNSSTNSYKRLVPGFEAPTMLAYSSRNRSVAIRIPHAPTPESAHIEVRFPDPCGNAYLGFSAMLMAGLDGIKHKIDPGEPTDRDLFDISPNEAKKLPHVCNTLQAALHFLDKDRAFLREGGVFTDDFIDSYIELKDKEVARLRGTTHPVEFDMYYDL